MKNDGGSGRILPKNVIRITVVVYGYPAGVVTDDALDWIDQMQCFAERGELYIVENNSGRRAERDSSADEIAGDMAAQASEKANVIVQVAICIANRWIESAIAFVDFREPTLKQRCRIGAGPHVPKLNPWICPP